MKKRSVDRKRAVVADDQAPEVPKPRKGTLDGPTPFVAPQDATVLGRRSGAVGAVGCDQQDSPSPQTLSQRVAVVALVGNHALRFLPRPAGAVPTGYLDRSERCLREPDLRRGRRTKVVPQRNSAAVDHHHPLRPFAPLGFSDFGAPFFAGAKLPSRNDSPQSNCSRWFNSLRNVRQAFVQMPRSSQSRSRRQQVEG